MSNLPQHCNKLEKMVNLTIVAKIWSYIGKMDNLATL